MSTPPNAPTPDVSLTPAPDYGTLGPGSDVKIGNPKPLFGNLGAPANTGQPRPLPAKNLASVIAIMSGAMFAGMAFFIAQTVNHTRNAQNDMQSASRSRTNTYTRSGAQRYDAASQKDAESLLQRAAHNDDNATSQLETRAASWRGRIQLTPQLTNFITAGLNANSLRARAATIRVDLAAMNVTEDGGSVDRLANQAESPDHATRIWALWTLGLLANRSVESDHVIELLTSHLADTDVESRHWAVEALAYSGQDAAIPPLLKTMHDDSSQMVRERAACGLAQSGMFTSGQRHSVIPTLLSYADDQSLDVATRAFTFHALRDISGKNLPDNAAAWRNWYESNR